MGNNFECHKEIRTLVIRLFLKECLDYQVSFYTPPHLLYSIHFYQTSSFRKSSHSTIIITASYFDIDLDGGKTKVNGWTKHLCTYVIRWVSEIFLCGREVYKLKNCMST